MAQLTALQALNKVLRNIGEAQVSALTGLNNIQMLAFEKLNESIQEVCVDQNTRWDFLESLGVIPMTTNSYQYQITAITSGSNMMEEDKESLRQPDSDKNITYITPQEFDTLRPKGVTTDITGYPDKYTKYAGYIIFDRMATSVQNGKNVYFRYWKQPTYYATDTATGKSDLPEPFDVTVVCNLATMKVLAYLGNEEAANYKAFVYGDGRDLEGALSKLKWLHSSPTIKPRMGYVF